MRIYGRLDVTIVVTRILRISKRFLMKLKGFIMKKSLMFLCIVLMFSGISFAAPVNQANVPIGAKWVMHVDLDSFGSSEMWSLISQEISPEDHKKLDALTNLIGSDPTKDIYGITLYGSDATEENAVVLINGKFNKEKLISLLVLNDSYSGTEYNGLKLHSWLDEKDNKTKVGAFVKDDLIVISQNKDQVKAFVDLKAGKGISLATQKDAPLATLSKAPKDAIIVMAANDISELNRDKQHDVVLRNSKFMAVVAGEDNGDMYMSIELIAESNESATQIEKMLAGIKAIAEMQTSNNPELLAVINSINFTRNESQLVLSVQYPSVKLYNMMKKMRP